MVEMADPVCNQQHFVMLCFTCAVGFAGNGSSGGQPELQHSRPIALGRVSRLDASVGRVDVGANGLGYLATQSTLSNRP